MTVISAPRSARPVATEWGRLHLEASDAPPFDPAMLDALPEPVQRLLRHALTPGVRLSPAVELTMHGQIRLGAWRPYTARQVLAPGRGFIWAATARVAGLPVTGFDRYSEGEGEMRWRLLGLLPVVSATGADVTRSAAGRLAGEAVLCPTGFRECRWDAIDDDRVAATWKLGSREETVEMRVGDDGRLREVRMQRWGNPGGMPFADYPFGVDVLAETDFGGVRIPSRLRAAWWCGTDREAEGEFFRAGITGATFA